MPLPKHGFIHLKLGLNNSTGSHSDSQDVSFSRNVVGPNDSTDVVKETGEQTGREIRQATTFP